MPIFFYDTETTGFPNDRAMDNDPCQPYIVQFAGLLTDDDGKELASTNVIIYPKDWVIPKDASDIHGITTELAQTYGIPLDYAYGLYAHFRARATIMVGHNIPFDERIMRIQLCKLKRNSTTPYTAKLVCTAELASPIVNIPPTEKMVRAGFHKPKTPSLSECYRHFFGEELDGAHDALVDVRACARVYFHIMRMKNEQGPNGDSHGTAAQHAPGAPDHSERVAGQ